MKNTEETSIGSSVRGLRQPRKICDAIIAGTLFDDLDSVASELYRALQYNHITVWMNADAQILYQPANLLPDVDAGWIAGTYGIGVGATEIAEDLLLLKAERRATGMLDD